MSITQQRVYNFSAGPAVMPVSVLEQARDEMLSYRDAGCSVFEMSHRGSHFQQIMDDAKQRLIDLLKIPNTHEILFLQGGSRLQFSMIPMNLLRGVGQPADYLVTGSWTKKAVDEAVREGDVQIAFDAKSSGYDRLPGEQEIALSDDPAYVYYTSNETIQGVQFATEPDVGNRLLVCDASSDFLCRPLDMQKYGLIYACAQKNAGPAGVTVVVIRKDLLERSSDTLPGYCNFAEHAAADSCYNTPPTYSIYIMGLVLKWLQEEIGGLEAMWQRNDHKAQLLYETIDNSGGFYQGHAQSAARSVMNVTFRLPSDELQAAFIQQAAARNLCNLKGHRSVGGIRASIYNAMPLSGVESLRDFMLEFHQQHA